jgi:integrase
MDCFSNYQAKEIGTDLVRLFITDQQAKGLANGSINRSLAALKRMFNLARPDGRLREVPYIPMLKQAAPKSGIFERAEYSAMLAQLPDYMKVPFAVDFFVGVRSEEVLGLRWTQVDLLRNTISLLAGETKNDDARVAPICTELRTLLVAQSANRQAGCERVCFKIGPKGHAERVRSVRKAWYSAAVRTGIGRFESATDADGKPIMQKPRGPRSKPKAALTYVGKTFHDLRRTGVRNLIRAGVDRDTARHISGHKSDSVFSRYNIVSERDIMDAGKLLDVYNAKMLKEATAAANSHSLATVGGFGYADETVN